MQYVVSNYKKYTYNSENIAPGSKIKNICSKADMVHAAFSFFTNESSDQSRVRSGQEALVQILETYSFSRDAKTPPSVQCEKSRNIIIFVQNE